MEVTTEHIRHVMLYEFNKGNNATETVRNIAAVYGEGTISVSQCQRWFQKFRAGHYSVQDEPRPGRPVKLDEDVLRNLVEQNPVVTVEELAEKLGCGHSTVHRHLRAIGKVSKLGQWVPHELSEVNRQQRVNVASSLLTRLRNEPLLDRIVTGDEKWILYKNVKRRRQWVGKGDTPTPQAKAGLHPRKVMCSVWWDMKGVIHYELLHPNRTITKEVYCEQLERLKSALDDKRPSLVSRRKVLFHQDNARPHTARITLQKLEEFEWETMPHPAYSPDIAPSDYHLFRSLQNHLDGETMDSLDDVRTVLEEYFASRGREFWKRGIESLPDRWRSIVETGGEYILD